MTIRQYAKENGHVVVGKLTRKPEWESNNDRWYVDEDDNEYLVSGDKVAIVTKEGGVI